MILYLLQKLNTLLVLVNKRNLYYNEVNSCIFGNDVETYKFKAKDSETNAAPLRLGIASKKCSVENMKKTGLSRYIYAFSIDCDSTDVADILYIYKYLMKKLDTKCLGLLKKYLLDY